MLSASSLWKNFKKDSILGTRVTLKLRYSLTTSNFEVWVMRSCFGTKLWKKWLQVDAGPFDEIPFEYYIQSPVGLVDKDKGRDTRLIFHLSHSCGTGLSMVSFSSQSQVSWWEEIQIFFWQVFSLWCINQLQSVPQNFQCGSPFGSFPYQKTSHKLFGWLFFRGPDGSPLQWPDSDISASLCHD